jgi:2',3'-cyclic-nucleotide 2'-phosphodiesterase (5'-nucleotidase family)
MIRLYHTSDLHDHRGFASRLQFWRASEPGLLMDCGDSLRGSQSVYHRREPIIEEIDRAGYDAQAIGNREFHYLFSLLRARARRMRHPLICSNLVDLRGRELPFVPAHMLCADDAREARAHFLALLIPQYPVGSAWERVFGWRFLPPKEVVAAYARGVPEGDALVILSHIGLRQDRELATAVPRIDLVLGGHSHDTLFEPVYVGDVPIVHAGPYGQYVSRTELQYDRARSRYAISRFDLLPLLGAP